MTLDKQLLLIGMYSESGKHVDFQAISQVIKHGKSNPIALLPYVEVFHWSWSLQRCHALPLAAPIFEPLHL